MANGNDLLIARGQMLGFSSFTRIGYLPSVPQSLSDVWNNGGIYPYPTGQRRLAIRSTSADDANGMSGATRLRLEFLDKDLRLHDEEVTLKGTQTVKTKAKAFRLIRAFCVGTGSYGGSNVGDIIIEQNNVPGVTIGRILPGQCRTMLGHYTVPADTTSYMESVRITMATGVSTEVDLYFRSRATDSGGNDQGPMVLLDRIHVVNGRGESKYQYPLSFASGHDIIWRAKASGVGAGALTVKYQLLNIEG